MIFDLFQYFIQTVNIYIIIIINTENMKYTSNMNPEICTVSALMNLTSYCNAALILLS